MKRSRPPNDFMPSRSMALLTPAALSVVLTNATRAVFLISRLNRELIRGGVNATPPSAAAPLRKFLRSMDAILLGLMIEPHVSIGENPSIVSISDLKKGYSAFGCVVNLRGRLCREEPKPRTHTNKVLFVQSIAIRQPRYLAGFERIDATHDFQFAVFYQLRKQGRR